MTKNFWIQHQDEVVTWSARLAGLGDTAETCFALLADVAAAGARHEVLMFDADPLAGLREQLATTRSFSLALGDDDAVPAANMCWYDATNTRSCGLVRDLGQLLARIFAGQSQINEGFRAQHLPPVRVWGSAFEVTGGRVTSSIAPAELCISLHSDIWFPYVLGLAYPCPRRGRLFDNRELADAHTPRLNAFLAEIAIVVARYGGRLALDDDEVGFLRTYRPWVVDGGIHIDGPVPDLMPAELSEAAWPARASDDDDGLE